MPPGADCHYPNVAPPSVDTNLILPFYALNQNLFLIRSSKFPTDSANCKDQIWLEPKTGMDPGPRNPNNKFVEGGIDSD